MKFRSVGKRPFSRPVVGHSSRFANCPKADVGWISVERPKVEPISASSLHLNQWQLLARQLELRNVGFGGDNCHLRYASVRCSLRLSPFRRNDVRSANRPDLANRREHRLISVCPKGIGRGEQREVCVFCCVGGASRRCTRCRSGRCYGTYAPFGRDSGLRVARLAWARFPRGLLRLAARRYCRRCTERPQRLRSHSD